MAEFMESLESARTKLNIPNDCMGRSINVGFSGGERKKLMLLRLVMTNPKLAILDEPDSGADAETQQQIAHIINEMHDTTFIFISHQKNFTYLISPTEKTTLNGGKMKQ
jgi:Fe-S cluster assembly ATP-binding protein